MHMSGAKEILRLRGGIQVIESNYSLRMILFWYIYPPPVVFQ
jgi:hypothetical protein